MSNRKIRISGTGCSLADFLYRDISFESPDFKQFQSKSIGDGGLSPGKLVFTGELERFAGRPYPEIIRQIIGIRTPDAFNVGGPSVVPLVHAAQLLGNKDYVVKFYGMSGNDQTAAQIKSILEQTPLNLENYLSTSPKATPFTDVLSDPTHDGGHGERTFINNIGAAGDYMPDHIGGDFFESEIVCFGGTALVPNIHDSLTGLLARARNNGGITVVNTVFDFRNEKKNPGKPWPLVDGHDDFRLIDILIMDLEESLRISGSQTLEGASAFFENSGVSSFVITNGPNDLVAWSDGGLFSKSGLIALPASRKVTTDLALYPEKKGDTTGCGDNFAGGIIASLGWQLKERSRGDFNLAEAVSWGIASGGFCCYTIGGTYVERSPGEKKNAVEALRQEYFIQTGY
jgi:sugar/nucleoside kinase (ribokinase family)